MWWPSTWSPEKKFFTVPGANEELLHCSGRGNNCSSRTHSGTSKNRSGIHKRSSKNGNCWLHNDSADSHRWCFVNAKTECECRFQKKDKTPKFSPQNRAKSKNWQCQLRHQMSCQWDVRPPHFLWHRCCQQAGQHDWHKNGGNGQKLAQEVAF